VLEAFIGVIIVLYFGVLLKFDAAKVVIIPCSVWSGSVQLRCRLVRYAHQHLRQRAHRVREPRRQAVPVYEIPEGGMSVGMLLISVELFLMLCILLFIPGDYAGRASSASPSASRSARRRSGSPVDLHEDRRHRVRPDEDRLNIKEDDAQPGRHRRLHGDNAGDSVGPSADGSRPTESPAWR